MFNTQGPRQHQQTPLGDAFGQLLAAARAGGEWAWRELYHQTAPTLARYLRARGVHEVDDIVGDTFVRIVQHIKSFSGDEAAFRTWAFTIARNLVVDGARRQARRPLELVPDERLTALGTTGDTETDALASLSADTVREALDELSPDQRDVLLLRILGDLTIAEVAAVMDRREGAIKMLQARGLANLRKKISLGAVTL